MRMVGEQWLRCVLNVKAAVPKVASRDRIVAAPADHRYVCAYPTLASPQKRACDAKTMQFKGIASGSGFGRPSGEGMTGRNN
jgi:hypothetical protein